MTVILACCGQLLLHFEACYFQTTFLQRVFVILDFSDQFSLFEISVGFAIWAQSL